MLLPSPATPQKMSHRGALALGTCLAVFAVLSISSADADALGHLINGLVCYGIARWSGLWNPLCRYVRSFRALEKLRDEQWWQETLQPLRPQLASSAHRASSSLPPSRKAQALPASKVFAA